MTFRIKKKKKEKLTDKQLNFLIKDEKKANIEYTKYGFTKLASDEKSHQKFLQDIKQKRKANSDKYKDDGGMSIVDDVYDMGEDIVQRANPFLMSGRSLGYSDDEQKDKIKRRKKCKRK
jgi:hypothetical protein